LKVREYIFDTLKKHKLHMTLIDPAKQLPKVSGKISLAAGNVGSDAIMVGGSTGVTQANLDSTVDNIKKASKLPVIYFPSGASATQTPSTS
jgi:phosphoglycerol geranylgeranyltransferase